MWQAQAEPLRIPLQPSSPTGRFLGHLVLHRIAAELGPWVQSSHGVPDGSGAELQTSKATFQPFSLDPACLQRAQLPSAPFAPPAAGCSGSPLFPSEISTRCCSFPKLI